MSAMADLSCAELTLGYRSGALSPVEVARDVLARIERHAALGAIRQGPNRVQFEFGRRFRRLLAGSLLLAATLASVVCTSPEVELRFRLRVENREWRVSTVDIVQGLPVGGRSEIAVARRMKERIAEGLAALHASE